MRTIIAASFLASLSLIACGATTGESPGQPSDSGATGPFGNADTAKKGDQGGTTSTSGDASTITTTFNDAGTSTGTGKKDPLCSAQSGEDDACTVEGAFCHPSPCTDECQFCNVLRCESGKWTRMEAFPMPASYCADVACGPKTCGKGQYCIRSLSGPKPADGGSGITYECGTLPKGCTGCACAATATTGCSSVSCTPAPQTGKPIVDCAYQ